jgi:hypothetical protein
VIIVRVTKSQYERIVNNAEAKGHKTISEFIRSSALGFDMVTEARIQKIFEIIVEKKAHTSKSVLDSSITEAIEV